MHDAFVCRENKKKVFSNQEPLLRKNWSCRLFINSSLHLSLWRLDPWLLRCKTRFQSNAPLKSNRRISYLNLVKWMVDELVGRLAKFVFGNSAEGSQPKGKGQTGRRSSSRPIRVKLFSFFPCNPARSC